MAEHSLRVAFVICGALAREVLAITQLHGWSAQVFGVAARDHMFPQRIAPDVEQRLRNLIPCFERVVVVYGDCGTNGALDELLARYRVPRIAGPHCYEMYGGASFAQLMDEEPGTFFLTDFLVRGFRGTVLRGLGIDRHPELQPIYFANYRRVVYLAQHPDETLLAQAAHIAQGLGLPLDVRQTGYGLLEARLVTLMAEIHEERYQPVLPPEEEQRGAYEHTDPDSLLARHSGTGTGAGHRRESRRATRRPLSRSRGPSSNGDGADRF